MPRAGAPYISVVGASQATPEQMQVAEEVGRLLAHAGAIVVTGGQGGVMAGASKGAADAGGLVVGFLPGLDRDSANEWVKVAIPTGLGHLRNGLVIRSADAVIAVAGAYGTLSEVALALTHDLRVFGLGTWAIEGIEPCGSPAEAVERALRAAA
jgi:uncharacterized protein (TIGR00725 family)